MIATLQTWYGNYDAIISLLIVVGVFISFIVEKAPPAVIAAIGAGATVAFGLLPTETALTAFSNNAVVTIAAMLILSSALIRTGVLEALATVVLQLGKQYPIIALALLFSVTFVLSAFINSTPVIIIMIPLMTTLAASIHVSAKRLLIPLSYTAVLAGTCTLLGTSTNLLVASIAADQGAAYFSIFDISRIGLIAAVTGGAAMLLFGRWLLPHDQHNSTPDAQPQAEIISEIRLGKQHNDIGKTYDDVALLRPMGIQLIAVYRQGAKIDTSNETITAKANDLLIVRVSPEELATLGKTAHIGLGQRSRTIVTEVDEDSVVARVTIASGNRLIGGTVADAVSLSRMGMNVIGASRHHHLAGPSLSGLRLKAGDHLYIQGSEKALATLAHNQYLILSQAPMAKSFRRNRAIISIAIITAVVALAAWGVMPIAGLALIGVGCLFLCRSIDTSDAWASINLDLLALIVGMLVIGMGLQHTGAIELLVAMVLPLLGYLPLFGIVLTLYLLTSLLTEMVSNNAVAVIMTPVALSLAEALQLSPEALLITIMFGASASFATPIGYQTNTLVYTAGDYRFVDFVRIGLPMNIIVGIASCAAISYFA